MISDLGPPPVLERWYPEVGAPFNVYASLFDLPGLPWWIGPETRMTFFRPLASALLHLDHGLFALRPLGYHVHSLLWLGGGHRPLRPPLLAVAARHRDRGAGDRGL